MPNVHDLKALVIVEIVFTCTQFHALDASDSTELSSSL